MKENKGFEIKFYLMALSLIFIFCKLTGHINWSWLLVLSPILIPIIAWLIFFIISIIILLISSLVLAIKGYDINKEVEKRIQDREDMQDRVNRKVADDMFNGEN